MLWEQLCQFCVFHDEQHCVQRVQSVWGWDLRQYSLWCIDGRCLLWLSDVWLWDVPGFRLQQCAEYGVCELPCQLLLQQRGEDSLPFTLCVAGGVYELPGLLLFQRHAGHGYLP